MDTQKKNRKFYHFAYDYLLNKTPPEVTEDLLKKYLVVPKSEQFFFSINDIFYRMLCSAQNRQMSVNVIGRAIGNVQNLGKVLDDFNVEYVLNHFSDYKILLEEIENTFDLKGKIRIKEKSLWPQYCKTIISVAKFLSQFKNSKDFLLWIRTFYEDNKSMAVLPLLISTEIYGFGFALVCDFLKELGFTNYGKPDVHIKEILIAYDFLSENESDYNVLKTMINIAQDANVTCYALDKVLWLIGSGKFYNNPEIGNNGFIGRMKEDFIMHKIEFEGDMNP